MPYPTKKPAWLRYLRFWRSNAQADIDAELHFHLDARIGELVALGKDPFAARSQALEEFGDVAAVRESLSNIDGRMARRHARGEWIDGLRQDAAYGIRSLLRTPAVTATIVVTLALGLGMNAAMFSFLDQVFAREPAGVVHPGTIRRLWWVYRFGQAQIPTFAAGFDYPGYRAVTEALAGRARTTIYNSQRQSLAHGENAPKASVVYAGEGYFEMLGIGPASGRLFSVAESQISANADVAIVSDAFRQRALNPDSSAIGQRVTIENRPFTVIGVMHPEFAGLDLDATDIWLPLGSFPTGRMGLTVPWWTSSRVNGMQLMIRPEGGASDRQIEDRATLALRSYFRSIGYTEDSVNVARVGPIIAAQGPGEQQQEVRVATRLAGVAAIVLLIACANVINLLLARAVRRRREIAVRLALGISRARLIRLLVVESVMLALVAAVAAVVAAQWGGSVLRTLLLPRIHWATAPLNWPVAMFAVGAALFAGIVAGLIPAWHASRPDLTGALKAGAREGVVQKSRLRSALVIAQAALSVLLLAGAALFVKSLQNVHDLDIGFAAERLAFATIGFDTPDTVRDQAVKRSIEQLAIRLRSMEGVERVALAGMRPMAGFSFATWYTDKSFPKGKTPETTFLAVSPEYFAATGLRVLRGTGFPDVHGAAMPRVVVINHAMADAVWPGEDPIGRCMRFTKQDAPCYTVVGIVENARRDAIIEDPTAQYYLPFDNMPIEGWTVPTLVIRAPPDRLAAIINAARGALLTAWPAGVPRITRMSDALEPQYRPWRLGATLFSTFGILALVIAAVGIFSTVSYSVSQRTHEFGVRIALGARIGDVLRLVVGEGLRTVAFGVVIGILLALAGGRLIASLLYGIKPNSPGVISIVASILLVVAALAALAPAWKAARVDAMTALRTD